MHFRLYPPTTNIFIGRNWHQARDHPTCGIHVFHHRADPRMQEGAHSRKWQEHCRSRLSKQKLTPTNSNWTDVQKLQWIVRICSLP